MAKKKLTPGGPPKGKIIVNSRTWGVHERAARGTHKPAPVNDAFRKASSLLQQANVYARLINNAIKPFNSNIKDGTLWSRLTQHFYPFIESKTPVDFRSLVKPPQPEGHEDDQPKDLTKKPVDRQLAIHKDHRLTGALVFRDVKLTTDRNRQQLQVLVKGLQFNFPNTIPDIDAAHVTMIVLYVHDRNEYVETQHQAAVFELGETEGYFELPIPPNTGVVLVCIKCEAYQNGVLSGNLTTKGIDFVRAESLQDIAVMDEEVEAVEQGREEPVIKPEPIADQLVEVDPMIAEPIAEPEDADEVEPIAKPETINAKDKVVEVESVIEAEAIAKPEETAAIEPIDKPEPTTEQEPAVELESVIKPGPVAVQDGEVEPATEAESPAEPVHVVEVEPIINRDPMADVAQVVDEEPLITPEAVAEVGQVVEVKSFTKSAWIPEIELVAQVEGEVHAEQITPVEVEGSLATADNNPTTDAPESQSVNADTDESNKVRKKKKKDTPPASARKEKQVEDATAESSNQLSLW